MAISRPFLLALLGIALLGATVFAVQNARTNAVDPAPAAQQTPAEQAAPAPPPAQPTGPDALLASAFSADVTSAAFDAKLTFSSQGEKNVIQATGSFEEHGEKAMPEANVQLRLQLGSLKVNRSGGFVTTGERAWFTRGGTAYAVPQSTWSQIVKARESGAKPASASPDVDLDPSGWLKDVKSEGQEQVGGVEATHVSAKIDSAKAVTEIVKAMGQASDNATPIPANAEQRLRQAGLSNGDLDVWVGDDKILRRVTLTLSGKGDGGRPVKGSLDFRLSGVNQPQDIARPANVKRGTPGGVYGQVANGVLGGAANAVGVDPKELRLGVPVTNSHLKAERAVADNKKVVIFFKNPRALDDQAVADSVRSLDRRMKSVVVLSDVVENVDRYGSLLEDLGVTQAPAIVVIDRNGKARLIEGYTDAESLAQVVADAR